MSGFFWDFFMVLCFLNSGGFLLMNFYFLKKKLLGFYVFPLVNKGYLNLDFSMILDNFSILFCFSVSVITMVVLNFSKSYMSEELFKFRFLLILFFFVFSMMLLIFSGNFFFLMIGWDGLGVISYLLVIYFFSSKSNNAGMLTILSNRIGDILLMMCISLCMSNFSWNLLSMLNNTNFSMSLSLLFCFGCFTKSAQIPFSAWLPAAMAAPTPVSSLVHSSTLVTAGIYLMFRLSALMNLYMIQFFGVLTMVMAGLNALKEIDMKKIVALSTLSQLGLMTSSLGLGLKYCMFFHLILHAYFKALLFVSVGNMIHFSDDYQDLRKINFYENFQSLTLVFCLFANLSLMGFPFLSGFFSKDLILEMFFIEEKIVLVFWGLFWGGCILTGMYSVRFFQSVFLYEHKSKSLIFKFFEDKNFILGGLVLFVLSVSGWSWVFWTIFDTPKMILVSLKLKILMGLILFLGFILMLMLEKWLSFGQGFSWGMFAMWCLPLYSKSIFKKEVLNMEFFITYGLDQFLVKEMSVLSEKYLESVKSEEGVFFLKTFKSILILFFLLFC